MKDKAKTLLKYNPIDKLVDDQIDLNIYDYVVSLLHDSWDYEIKSALIENGEDISEYDPLYDDWQDMMDSEGENVAFDLAAYAIEKMSFPDDVINNIKEEITEEVSRKILDFFNKNSQYVFYQQ